MVFALFKAALRDKPRAARDRRSLPRVAESRATVIVGKTSYTLVDWHPDGFRIGFYDGTLRPGDRVRVRMVLPHREISYGLDLNCEVRHVDPLRLQLGAAFVDVDPTTSQRLRRAFADRIRRPAG